MEKPTFDQRMKSFGSFLYNSETGNVLGRGAKSWAEIGIFYIIYYACLTSFFAATLAVFYQTVPVDEPKLLGDDSLLDGNPGMGFRPHVDKETREISFSPGGKAKNGDEYENIYDDFLKKYENVEDVEDCTGLLSPRPDNEKACAVKLDEFTSCNAADEYGMKDDEPCILVKLNRVYNWTPKLHDDLSSIKGLESLSYNKEFIPIRCTTKDKSKADKLGEGVYFPQQGFPVKYYPYKKQKNYRSPVVFVKFPNMTTGVKHEIECRAYAKNINYDRTGVQGSVQFNLKMKK